MRSFLLINASITNQNILPELAKIFIKREYLSMRSDTWKKTALPFSFDVVSKNERKRLTFPISPSSSLFCDN
jgi:hypothetical protein